METREAKPADAAVIAALLDELGYQTTPAAILDRLHERGEADKVLITGEQAGLIAVHRIPRLAEGTPIARITALVAARGERRKGVAQALLSAAERVARGWGCELLEVSSGRRPERDAAHRFYAGAGFHDTAERSTRYWKTLV